MNDKYKEAITPMEERILMSIYIYPRYGLEVIETVAEATNGEIQLKQGTVYPLLRQLVDKGFAECYWGSNDPGDSVNARRRYYSITKAGKELLREREAVRQRLVSAQKKEALPLEEIQELPVPEPSRKPLSIREPVAIE